MSTQPSVTQTGATLAAMAAAAAAAGTDAVAADLVPVKAAHVPTAWSWEGFYVGGSLGAGLLTSSKGGQNATWGNQPNGYVGIGGASVPFLGSDNSGRAAAAGFLGGLQAGWNWQTGHYVYGVEADFSWLGGSSTNSVGNTSQGYTHRGTSYSYNGTIARSSHIDSMGTLRARFGYDINNGTLPYVTVGLAVAQINSTFSYTGYNGTSFRPLGLSTSTVSKTSWVPGVVVGAGLEQRINRNWSVRGEVQWAGFASQSLTNPVPPASNLGLAATGQGTIKFSDTLTTIKLGANYRF